MDWKQISQKFGQFGSFLLKWGSNFSIIFGAIGYCVKFLKWGSEGPFSRVSTFLQEYALTFLLFAIIGWLIIVGIWTRNLHKKFTRGFVENFKGNLNDNWDFVGPWRIAEKGTLLVTGSDEGGITKLGTYWENYTMTFKARIINKNGY